MLLSCSPTNASSLVFLGGGKGPMVVIETYDEYSFILYKGNLSLCHALYLTSQMQARHIPFFVLCVLPQRKLGGHPSGEERGTMMYV